MFKCKTTHKNKDGKKKMRKKEELYVAFLKNQNY